MDDWSCDEIRILDRTLKAGRVPLAPGKRDSARFRLAAGDALVHISGRRERDTSPCLDRADRDGSIGKKLHAFGWCHSLNRLIGSRLGLSGLIYASYHRARERPAGLAHNGCDANNCVAPHVPDTALYSLKYTFSDCECKNVIPSFCRISKILSSGNLPLIDARLPPDGVKNLTWLPKQGFLS